jgi:hypothetical protein
MRDQKIPENLEVREMTVNGWFDRSCVIEILCNAIDEAGTIGDFAEFLDANFGCLGKDSEDVPMPFERQEYDPG